MSALHIETAEVFEPLLEPARDKVARGGRGSGKSHFFAGLLIEDALAEPGISSGEGLFGVCIREVQKDLAQSSKLLIENKLRSFGLGEADGFKVYKDVIKTPGDGIIIFKGMNDFNADSIKSLEGFKRAWWEEAHGAAKTSINLLRPTMRASGSQMWWSYNRRLKKDAVDVMFTGELPTGAIVVDANWRDNPWLTAELVQERLDCLRLQPEAYPHIWEGEYVTALEGAYFAKQLAEAKLKKRICRLSADPLMTLRSYHDIGGSGAKADAYSIWIVQFVDREIRVLDHYSSQGQSLAFHVAWMRANGYSGAEIVLPHDGVNANNVSGKQYKDHWEEAGFKSVRVIPNQGPGAAMMRIEAVRRLFPRIYFDEDLTQAGRDALGWYHEKKDPNGHGLGPNHDWSSHDADSFGLMCIDYKEPTTSVGHVNIPSFGAV